MMFRNAPHTGTRRASWPTLRSSMWVLMLTLIAVGIGSRFLLIDWPNFKPVTALAIFCGFICASRGPVALALAAAMLVSDVLLGFYEWPLMVGVYACLLLSIWLGSRLRLLVNQQSVLVQIVGIGLASLSASLLFFLLTNAAVWLAGWYPPTFAGLMQSYVAGIPFFRFTVAGDLCFSLLLFSSWYAVRANRSVATHRFQPAVQEISSTGRPRTSTSG